MILPIIETPSAIKTEYTIKLYLPRYRVKKKLLSKKT